MDITKEILWYGKDQALPVPRSLHAGPLDLVYEHGSLRNILLGELEVLRMIYFALRDQSWGTITQSIQNEQIIITQEGFKISFESHFHKQDIHFLFRVAISSIERNSVIFEIDGVALSDFLTNRLGFCILHPIEECKGIDCEIINNEGESQLCQFPVLVSPHQPMKNITEMSWGLGNIGKAHLKFEGDIFEMEDQRNWTDDSYKTYCRPLDLPFPYLVKKGDKIRQKISLSVRTDFKRTDPIVKPFHLTYDAGKQFSLPAIGIGRSSLKAELSSNDVELIKNIHFDYYEVSVVFTENWGVDLAQSFLETRQLQLPLKLKLYLSDDYAAELASLQRVLGEYADVVSGVVILHDKKNVAPEEFLEKVIPPLKTLFIHAKIGAGTSGFFAQLNRNRIKNRDLDFLCFAITPQVHAFDNLTLVENLNGQADTVQSAMILAEGKEIHVSPVTFQKQPAATQAEAFSDTMPSQIDVRQMSLFGAGWTLGSIKKLAESGASAVTYFETIGEKGIIQGDRTPSYPNEFITESGAVFPLYYVFKEILKQKSAHCLYSISSHPTVFEGLVLTSNGLKTILLANFTNEPINVRVDGINASAMVKKLDEKNALKAMVQHKEYISSPYCEFNFEGVTNTFKIRPYGLVTIEETKSGE